MYSVKISNHRDSTFEVKSKDYEFTIDTEGKGVTPPDALLASLGSCIGVYIRKYCSGTNLDIKEFEISVNGELSKDKPISFRKIFISIDLKGLALDELRKKSLLRFAMNCPIHNTIKGNPNIDVEMK